MLRSHIARPIHLVSANRGYRVSAGAHFLRALGQNWASSGGSPLPPWWCTLSTAMGTEGSMFGPIRWAFGQFPTCPTPMPPCTQSLDCGNTSTLLETTWMLTKGQYKTEWGQLNTFAASQPQSKHSGYFASAAGWGRVQKCGGEDVGGGGFISDGACWILYPLAVAFVEGDLRFLFSGLC